MAENVVIKYIIDSSQIVKVEKNWNLVDKEQKEVSESLRLIALNTQKTSALLEKSSKKQISNTKKINKETQSYITTLGNLKNAIAGAFVATGLVVYTQKVFQLTKEVDSLNFLLKNTTDSQEDYNRALEFTVRVANQTGTEIASLTRNYTKFSAATKGTRIEGDKANDIFESTIRVLGLLGSSTENINGTLTAFEQIISKGTVQSEELRGQIGERIPGAFQIAARAIGLTTKELSKQLELGNVIADDFLPKFAEELERTFNPDGVVRIENLTAAQNRFGNSITQLFRTIEGGDNFLTGFFRTIINGSTDFVDSINKALGGEVINNFFEDLKEGRATVDELNSRFEENERVINNSNNKILATSESLEKFNNAFEENKVIKDAITQYREFEKIQGRVSFLLSDSSVTVQFLQNEVSRLTQLVSETEGYVRLNKEYAEELQVVKLALEQLTEQQNENNKSLEQANGLIKNQTELVKNLKKEVEEQTTVEGLILTQERLQRETARLNLLKRAYEEFSKDLEEIEEDFPDFDLGFNGENIQGREIQTFADVVKDADEELTEFFNSQQEERTKNALKASKDRIQQEEDEGEAKKEILRQTTELAQDLLNAQFEFRANDIQRNIDNLEFEKNRQLEIAGDNAESREVIERRFNQKINQERLKQFRNEQNANIANALTNTAVAVTKALSSAPPPFNLVLAGISGAAGALQIAKIRSTPPPQQLKDGTRFVQLNGNPKGVDTIPAMLDEGERVVSKKLNRKNFKLYNAIEEGKITMADYKFLTSNSKIRETINNTSTTQKVKVEIDDRNLGKNMTVNQTIVTENGLQRFQKKGMNRIKVLGQKNRLKSNG